MTSCQSTKRLLSASVWRAALVAADCRACADGQVYPVEWVDSDRGLRFSPKCPVVVQPLGIAVGPTDTLEVYWNPGETGFDFVIFGPDLPEDSQEQQP